MERRPETEWQRQMRREENKFIRGSDGHGGRLFGRASCGGGSGRRKGRKQTKQIKTWKHIYKRLHVRRRRTRWDVPQQIRSQRIKRKSQQKIKGERWRRGCRLFTCTQWRSSATLDLGWSRYMSDISPAGGWGLMGVKAEQTSLGKKCTLKVSKQASWKQHFSYRGGKGRAN